MSDLISVVASLNDKLGGDTNLFTVGSEVNWSNVPCWTSTGSTLLDAVMTSFDRDGKPVGSGWAAGRWYEIYGPEASGKSTIMEHGFAQTQLKGGIPALLDSESKLDKERAVRIGVDLNKLVLFDAPYIEKAIEGFNMYMAAIHKNKDLQGRPIMIAWDTLAAAKTFNEWKYANKIKNENEDDPKKYAGGMTEKPRAIHSMFRDLTNKLSGFNTCFLVMNQVSSAVGAGRYQKQTDTTGGWAPRFYSSARLNVEKVGLYNDPYDKEMVAGIRTRITFEKSSMFKPYAQVEIPINFETGIDDLLSVVEFHANLSGVIEANKGNYKCPDYFGKDAPGKRLANFLDACREDDLLTDFLKERVRTHVKCFWKKAAGYAAAKKEEA